MACSPNTKSKKAMMIAGSIYRCGNILSNNCAEYNSTLISSTARINYLKGIFKVHNDN